MLVLTSFLRDTNLIFIMQGVIIGTVFIVFSYLSGERLGMGDAILFGIFSMYWGARDSMIILWIGFTLSGIFGVILLLRKKIDKEGELPFLPFMAMGHYIWLRLVSSQKAVYTVEIACIMPIVILIITGVILTTFYFHDKNILYSKVYETGVIGRQMYHNPEGVVVEKLESFMDEKCVPKMLLFSQVEYSIEVDKDEILIEASMEKASRRVTVQRQYQLNHGEEEIRKMITTKELY